MKTKSKKGPSEKNINAVILKVLIDKYGTPIGKEDAEELGIDKDGPVKGLDLYHGDGLSYYDKFNKETVYVWAIYLDRKDDVRVAFWHDPGKTDEPSDDAEFHCGDPSDFAAWEINLIVGEISERMLKENHDEDIRSQITSALVGNPIDKAPELLGAYGNVSFIDEKIDDGCDDPEDNYVMMRSYDVGDLYVRLYYGDVTRTIATVDVQ